MCASSKNNHPSRHSSAVAVSLEVEVELEHSSVEDDSEAELVRRIPLAIHDLEGGVLVGRACVEAKEHRLRGLRVPLDVVNRRLRLIDQVGVEYVELVPLDSLRRRIVVVVVSLVVLVPLVACLHAVEEAWFSRLVLAFPLVALRREAHLAVEFVGAAFASRVEGDLARLHAPGLLRRDPCILLGAIQALVLGARRASAGLREGLHERLPDLAHEPLVVVGVEQVLLVVLRERLQDRAAGPVAVPLLLQHAEGLQHGAQVAALRGRLPALGEVVPLALARLRWRRGPGRCLGAVSVGFLPSRRLLTGLLVPVVDLRVRHEKRDLRRDGVEKLRVHALAALLKACLDLDEHVLQL
mmetsp:Transcript_100341/g.321755  ORF Transcript_100341/g.321755 Transcript_100341/m.321755 type:complete len:354 (+) Transcript_100341:2-1063(+)